MKKHKAKTLEFAWGEPEAFRLEVEIAVEGERVQREKARHEQDREQSRAGQLDLLGTVHKSPHWGQS